MESAKHSIRWMTEKAEAEREKLEKSELALQTYMREKDIITIENRIAITPEKMREYSTQLTRAEAKRKELEALYRLIQRTKASELETVPDVAADTAIGAINRDLMTAEQRVSDLSKKYGPKHPAMKKAVSELSLLKKGKARAVKKVVRTIRNGYQLARAKENDIRSLLAKAKSEAVNLNEKFIQYGILKREVETNRFLYNALVKKIKERGLSGENQTVNVRVLERAALPERPAKPNKKRNILLGLALGLAAGVGLAFFVEYFDNTIKDPEQLESHFGTPVLGSVATVKPEKGQTIVSHLLGAPNSAFSECYRTIRTGLILSSANAAPRTMVVTSVVPQEGKSTTALNIAVTFARSGKRVILVDADMRRPMLHNLLEVDNASGLSLHLAGAQETPPVRSGPQPSLDVITAGPVPPNPSELLSSPRLPALIETLSREYDLVLFDSPPVASISDALLLGKAVEGTLLVIRAGQTPREMIGRGLKALEGAEVRVTGAVLNGVNVKESAYYYGYDSYYYSSEPEDA